MFLLNWYREFLEVRRDYKTCKSCEALTHQLEIALTDKQKLVDSLTRLAMPQPAAPAAPVEFKPVTGPLPWKAMRQQLEAEDRKTAQLMRERQAESEKLRSAERGPSGGLTAVIPNTSVQSVESLEKELGVE